MRNHSRTPASAKRVNSSSRISPASYLRSPASSSGLRTQLPTVVTGKRVVGVAVMFDLLRKDRLWLAVSRCRYLRSSRGVRSGCVCLAGLLLKLPFGPAVTPYPYHLHG